MEQLTAREKKKKHLLDAHLHFMIEVTKVCMPLKTSTLEKNNNKKEKEKIYNKIQNRHVETKVSKDPRSGYLHKHAEI